MSIEAQLFAAARDGDLASLSALLDANPDKLLVRAEPYEWTLLHTAANAGHAAAVDELLRRGLDPNTRERGDNSYAMHWAAAGGHPDIVRRLADAGGDVIGEGDDHQLEVIGWATCWPGCDDGAHRAVADFLVSRGARHHIFSAIALNLAGEVRRIVAEDASALNRRQSRNENHRTPLQFAVLHNRREMVALLVELGADALAADGSGQPVAVYATSPDVDHPVIEKIRARPTDNALDLITLLALRDWDAAERLLRDKPGLIEPGNGVLHVMAKRNDAAAVEWLLGHGADPNGRWAHWDADVTPLHLAASRGHVAVVQLLLSASADPTIRDSKHESDPIGWAEFFGQPAIAEMLRQRGLA